MVNKYNKQHKEDFSSSVPKKRLHELLHLEDIVEGRRYAFTFNPNYEVNEFFDLREFLEQTIKHFKCLRGSKVRLYLESSKSGRLHFHGFIWFTNKVKWAVYDFKYLKDKGSLCIKDMYLDPYNNNIYDSHLAWLIYCLKIQNEMQDFIMSEILPMIQKDKNFDCTDRNLVIDTYNI